MILAHPKRPSRRRSAFTLLEVLVVVAIILVLASVSTVAVLQIQESNKNDIARLKAITIEKAVKIYTTRNDGNPPENLAQVVNLIDSTDANKLQDPWGAEYQLMFKADEAGNQVPYIQTTSPKNVVIRSDMKTVQ